MAKELTTPCRRCSGRGYVIQIKTDGQGRNREKHERCTQCGGRGWINV